MGEKYLVVENRHMGDVEVWKYDTLEEALDEIDPSDASRTEIYEIARKIEITASTVLKDQS